MRRVFGIPKPGLSVENAPMDAPLINIYARVAPIVLALVLIEFVYCLKKKNGYYSFQDSIIGLGTAIIAQCVNLAVAVLVVSSYGWVYDNFRLFEVEPTLWSYIVCYIGVDFLFYWFHRAGHRINVLWAAHVPHHSAEELNYAVALRSSFTQRAASFLFYWPLAVLGFSPEVIIPMVALNLVLQFIPHTRVIGKLPSWIDSWLNTPYHHQVHHAANEIYWDKNYGGTFIIWDKMFGSYADQTEPPFYGVSIHPKSWDATYLNMHWFIVIFKDAWNAKHFVDKIKVWFMPPGWRPREMPPFPKNPNKDEKTQVKYQTQALPGSKPYLIAQMIFSMAVMMLVVSERSLLTVEEKIWVSALLWIGITIWGAILESKPWALFAELTKTIVFAVVLVSIYNRAGMDPMYSTATIAVSGVFFIWAALRMRGSSDQATPVQA